MLDIANKYIDQLKDKYQNLWFDEHYKYYFNSCYYSDFELAEDTWGNHQFVSVRNKEVIGYIAYQIDRDKCDYVHGLEIVNFEKSPSLTFSIDLGHALKDIFEKYHFRKLSFSVIVGNPIEKSYDAMCKRHGGRIVGVQKQNSKLIDGLFYDEKIYEVLREDYERSKHDKTARKDYN